MYKKVEYLKNSVNLESDFTKLEICANMASKHQKLELSDVHLQLSLGIMFKTLRTSHHYGTEGLKGDLSWASVTPRDASFSASNFPAIFFQQKGSAWCNYSSNRLCVRNISADGRN